MNPTLHYRIHLEQSSQQIMNYLNSNTGLKKKIVNELASFLNVVPQQINTWDRKVVDFMVRNPDIFIEFKNGCHYAKWEIYQSIRFDR